jgi:hypothetical protein
MVSLPLFPWVPKSVPPEGIATWRSSPVEFHRCCAGEKHHKETDSACQGRATCSAVAALDSTKSRFGILVSRKGVTGSRDTRHAAREQLKLFQDRGIVVIVVDQQDIEAVIAGYNFIALLRDKYEAVRLDLMPDRGPA